MIVKTYYNDGSFKSFEVLDCFLQGVRGNVGGISIHTRSLLLEKPQKIKGIVCIDTDHITVLCGPFSDFRSGGTVYASLKSLSWYTVDMNKADQRIIKLCKEDFISLNEIKHLRYMTIPVDSDDTTHLEDEPINGSTAFGSDFNSQFA